MGGVILNVDGTSPLLEIAKYYNKKPLYLRSDYQRFIKTIRIGSEAMPMFEFFSDKYKKPVPENINDIMCEGIKAAKLHNNLVNYVLSLKKKGLRILILSNSIVQHSDWIRSNGWYDYFDKVYLSHEIGLSKPDQQAYTHLIEKEKITPFETIFVDDLLENIETADRLGFNTILSISEQQVIDNLERLLHSRLTLAGKKS